MSALWPGGEHLTLLTRAAAAATSDVRLIAPFIKADVAGQLLSAVPEGVPVSVITRWRPDEVAAGVSDLEVFDRVRERAGARLLICPPLHAKLYVFGVGLCYVGSANLTGAALEGRNLELLGEFRPTPLALLRFAERAEALSHLATAEERVRVAAAAATLRRRYPPPPPGPDVGPLATAGLGESVWIPRFRHPAELFTLYVDSEAGAVPDAVAAAAHDLARIDPPDGLSREEFRAATAEALSTNPLVTALDMHLQTPRFFGPLRAWLEQRTGLQSGDAAQALQTLIRWLLWAYPGRYRLEQPHHSERFGRSEADWEIRRRGRRR